MRYRLRKRAIGAVSAAVFLLSSISNTFIHMNADSAADTCSKAMISESGHKLCNQSFELYPNGEEAEQIVTLKGIMPDGAEAEAVDVSEDYDGIAAYDITIKDGDNEYQPGESNPVFVEINDPDIPESDHIELWHIKDGGEREQIFGFEAEYGKISFYAAGFSVYEIVNPDDVALGSGSWKKVSSLEELVSYASYGLYIGHKNGFYFMNTTTVENSRTGITKTKPAQNYPASNAVPYYFEKADGADDQFYVYCFKDEVKQYVYNGGNNSLSFTDEDHKIAFTVTYDDNKGFRFCNGSWYWNMQGGDNGKRFCSYNVANDNNNYLDLLYNTVSVDDPYMLNNKTYGLMNFTGGTYGYSLIADSSGRNVHSLIELVTHQTKDAEGVTLYVDEGSETTRWTFHSLGEDKYKLSADTEDGIKYLGINGDELIITDSAGSAAEFRVIPDNNKRIQLVYNNKYVTCVSTDDGQNNSTSFSLSSISSENTWLNFIGFATLKESDLITYSADRISVSEAVNGKKVIVYTRLWDDVNKKYDMYAVDYNGTLYPCYASGGKILWLGDGTGSLEWIFTEYLDPVTKEPSNYYELYNTYSEKFIAPQITGNQLLSEEKIGINMPGRKKGDYYSEIVAWDDIQYAYIGMRPNEKKTKLVPCSQSVSVPFYFATLEALNLSDSLHEVETIDNNEHGIIMKMKDFAGTSGGTGATEQNAYLKDTTFVSEGATKGLVSNSLNEDGYPIATKTGKDLKDLYAGAETVNHLFLKSVYNSGGYFEFDSTQNFASLAVTNDNNFTVYRELGTSDGENKSTLKHGQFFPYNTISVGNYSTSNPQNIYDTDARTNDQSKGVLDENNPRKYEKLYSAGHKSSGNQLIDYYFGMEMSAQFVQTVSGLDAWGHDIIFEFKGDDDFWFYVDNELVIDLGGIHSSLEGKVNFRTGEVSVNGEQTNLIDVFRANYESRGVEDIDSKLDEIFELNNKGQYVFKDYSTHTMRVFFMERGAGASNLHMRMNLASVTPGHVVISKGLQGNDKDVLDTDFLEYPFQIYYTEEDEDGNETAEKLLSNDNEHIRVTYQNSNQAVTYVQKYRPPGFKDEDAYHCIYFINPTKNAEISFPNNTIRYRIVECAVDSTVYGNVQINGQDVPEDRIEVTGDLKSYYSNEASAETRPSIVFDNFVNDDVIKDLYITKKLQDENGNDITDDPTTFDYRLAISSVDVSADNIPLANMYKYYIISPGKKLCKRDTLNQTFTETSHSYSRDFVKSLNDGPVDGIAYDDVTFVTSPFGAISGIPAGYTVCVPGLPVGSVFKVTEDVKAGYGLDRYERVWGEKIETDGTVNLIPSYHDYGDNPINVGEVIADSNPQIEIFNKKGFSLNVSKKWSDLDITTSHSSVYTAVYVDGTLLEDSVRQIRSPSTSAYYFWTSLKPYPNGKARTDLDGYVVKEVKLGNASPIVAADGTVTNYGTVTPVEAGQKINLTATRTASATPEGEDKDKNYDYVVSYTEGEFDGSSRNYIISNTREGGIAVRLFKWDSSEPLSGGEFILEDSDGNTLGEFTADSEGIVAMLYSFEMDKLYTLTQTSAPKGYVGLQKKLRFKVNADETVSLYHKDGITEWGADDVKLLKWADGKEGKDGITAFVDVYNKPFNFKIVKTDSEDSGIKLGAAHFALYKQANTTISGYVKNRDPMTGFEDLATENGEVDICGGNSGRVINPGEKGSVYFLTETKAPFNYTKLDDDIVFRISAIGVPSLISDSYHGELYEAEDSYIYTLSVPNVKKNAALETLTIEKKVEGAFGNKDKAFGFTIAVDGAENEDGLIWAKNGEEQSPMTKTGGTFTLKHDDSVEIVLPVNVTVTVSEDNEEYKTTFRLDNEAAESVTSKEFTFTGSMKLVVTNTLDGEIATGISSSLPRAISLVFVPMLPIGMILYFKRKRKWAYKQ